MSLSDLPEIVDYMLCVSFRKIGDKKLGIPGHLYISYVDYICCFFLLFAVCAGQYHYRRVEGHVSSILSTR